MDETKDNNSTNAFGWLLAGAAIGSVATMLFYSGTKDNFTKKVLNTQKDLVRRRDDIANTVSDRTDDVQDLIVDKMEDLADFLKNRARAIKKAR